MTDQREDAPDHAQEAPGATEGVFEGILLAVGTGMAEGHRWMTTAELLGDTPYVPPAITIEG